MTPDPGHKPDTLESAQQVLPPERSDRIRVAFDDHRLVTGAGLTPPVTLAHHFGVGELVGRYVDQGDAPDQANAGR